MVITYKYALELAPGYNNIMPLLVPSGTHCKRHMWADPFSFLPGYFYQPIHKKIRGELWPVDTPLFISPDSSVGFYPKMETDATPDLICIQLKRIPPLR